MRIIFDPLLGELTTVLSTSTTASNNFSWKTVPIGTTVQIPLYQEMTVIKQCVVDGTLIVDGTLSIIL